MGASPPSYESIQADHRIFLSNLRGSPPYSPRRKPVASSLLPLVIPTKKYPLSSGFPYHSKIFDLGVSPDTWSEFSDEIVQATRLSLTQQSLAWTSGIGIGLVSVAAVPPFGAAAGVFAGKAVYDKSIMNNVRQGLEQGKLGEVLKRWNEDYWHGKEMVATLVVKQSKNQYNGDNHNSSEHSQKKKWKREAEKKGQRPAGGKGGAGGGHFELLLESINKNARLNATRASVIVHSSSYDDGIYTNTVPVELADSTDPTDIQSTPIELPIMSNTDFPDEEIYDPALPPLPPRPTQDLAATPSLVREKAAQADAVRSSWEQTRHPSHSYQKQRNYITVDEQDEREQVSSVKEDDYHETFPRPSFDQTSQGTEISPVVEAEQSYLEHLHTAPIDMSLAPAPLFAR